MTFATRLQYIVTTMRTRIQTAPIRLLWLCLMVLLLGPPLHAAITIRDGFGSELGIGWYGSIPSEFHEDPLPIRTHLTFGGTITPAAFRFGSSHEFSAGLSSYYTNRSLVYGATIWRPFLALGPTIDYTYHLNERFSLSPGLSLFAGVFLQTMDVQPILRITLAGAYAMHAPDRKNRWFLTLPLSVDLRSDYVALTTGLGMKWRYERTPKERTQ